MRASLWGEILRSRWYLLLFDLSCGQYGLSVCRQQWMNVISCRENVFEQPVCLSHSLHGSVGNVSLAASYAGCGKKG